MPRLAPDLCENGFYTWTKAQAAALRVFATERRNTTIDAARLAEEVGDLGKDQCFACRSQVRTILEHLLKLQLSPATDRSVGWERTILLARATLDDRLTKTLENGLEANLDHLYRQVATLARQSLEVRGEHEAAACIPERCPFTLEEVRQ